MKKYGFLLFSLILFSTPSWATNYYVSPSGDNTDGLSIATAKTEIHSGLHTVGTGGGHTLYVKPARYRERMMHPTNPGVSGSNNTLIGDTDGAIFGVRGYVIIDASVDNVTHKGAWTTLGGTGAYTTEHNGWAYWNMKKLWFTGGDIMSFGATTMGTLSDTNIMEDLIVESYGYDIVVYPDFFLDVPDQEGKAIVWRRCSFINHWPYTVNMTSFGSYPKNNSGRTYPHLIFERCYFNSSGLGSFYAGQRGYVQLKNCTYVEHVLNLTTYIFGGGASISGAKIEDIDCFFIGKYFTNNMDATFVSTRRKTYEPASTVGTFGAVPLIQPPYMLYPGSPLIDSDASVVGVFPDYFGVPAVRGTYPEPGMQEWNGKYPDPPNMRLPKKGFGFGN